MKHDQNAYDILPLTAAQAGMLFHVLEDPIATPYVAVVTCTLKGPLDQDRLHHAMQQSVQDRDAFRARFIWDGVKQPVQVVSKQVSLPWQNHDWSNRHTDDAKAALENLISLEQSRRFDVSNPPLMHAQLIRHSETSHTLVWTVHHLISDGWSTGVVLRDVMLRYQGQDAEAQPKPNFKDYLIWLRKSGRETPDKEFWTSHLADAEASQLNLAPVVAPSKGQGHLTTVLGSDLLARVQAFCRTARVTPNSYLSAVWSILLRHINRSDDVIFGQTSAGRPVEIANIDRAAGAFLNTLPLRIKIDPTCSVASFVQSVEQAQRDWRRHAFAALNQVQALSGAPKGTPLFDTLFVSESVAQLDLPSGDVDLIDLRVVQSSNYALALLVKPEADFPVELYFDQHRVGARTAQEILTRFARLVSGLMLHPSGTVCDAIAKTLIDDDTTPTPSRYTTSILTQFLDYAHQTPQAPAISDGARSLSYAELASRAAVFADALRRAGARAGDIIPVALDRGTDSLAAYLGIWMVRAAYVPMDMTYPAHRNRQILDEVAPKHIITQQDHRDAVERNDTHLVVIEDLPSSASIEPETLLAQDTAYVIFTSGSQGKPKGVVISHAALSHSTGVRAEVYDHPPSAFLVLSSLAFDSSVPGLFWPLTCGGQVVLAPYRSEQDPQSVADLISMQNVSHCLCLPSLAQVVLPAIKPEDLQSLRTLIVAGEALPASLCELVADTLPDVQLVNEYGPTETTVWSTAYDATHHMGPSVPIGTALPGTQVNVCDTDVIPLPEGINGEVVVSGPTLADGYLNQPSLTDQRFPHAPNTSQTRTYRTGDLGYFAENGCIYHLGRLDTQVKIRGHRVELAEVERIAQDIFPNATCAAFVAKGTLYLALEGEGPKSVDPKKPFATRLPAAATPKHIFFVNSLPRLPNGKIDRGALEQLNSEPRIESAKHQTPKSDLELQLATVFCDVLGVDEIGLGDNFFELGGDSLATIAAYGLARQNGLSLAPTDLFEAPDIRSLSHRILARSNAPVPYQTEPRMVHANANGDRAAVLLVHGTIGLFHALSKGLGDRHALGLQFSDYQRGSITALHKSVETYADEVIENLRILGPTGPYVLCAYSAGAVIALEAAHKLGDEVAQIVLIDPPYHVLSVDPAIARTKPAREIRAKVRRKLRARRMRHVLRVFALKALAPILPNSEWRRRKLVRSAYVFALSKYRLNQYHGPVEVIVTPGNPAMEPDGSLDILLSQKTVETIDMKHTDVISTPEGIVAVSSRIVRAVRSAQGQTSPKVHDDR